MRNRQLCAVTLAAASVPALLYLPRLGWVWATAAAAISALLLGLCGRRCAPGGLTEVIPAAFGRAGRAVLALVLLGGSLLLGGAARALCAIYPESRGGPLTGLLLLLAAAYAAERGEETVLRSGAILFFFLTTVEAVILGFFLYGVLINFVNFICSAFTICGDRCFLYESAVIILAMLINPFRLGINCFHRS